MSESETGRQRSAERVSWSPLAYKGSYYARIVGTRVVKAVLTWQEKSGEVKFSLLRRGSWVGCDSKEQQNGGTGDVVRGSNETR